MIPITPYGSAIILTKKNRKKVTILNGGVAPKLEDKITIFVYPYDYDPSCEILTLSDFDKKYEWWNRPSDDYLVDITLR